MEKSDSPEMRFESKIIKRKLRQRREPRKRGNFYNHEIQALKKIIERLPD